MNATQTTTRRTWTRDEIAAKLATDDAWVARGLIALYDRQTADEKATQDTKHDNGVGFNGADARILSSIAQWYKRTGRLSEKQIALVRRKIRKYATQLTRIANGEL
jgi:hypothetical protein